MGLKMKLLKQNIKSNFIFCCVFILINSFLHTIKAQKEPEIKFTLGACLQTAEESAPAFRSAAQNYRRAYWAYMQWRASFLPQLNVSGSAPQLTRAINSIIQPDGQLIYRTQSQATSNLSLNLTQPIAATGTRLTFSNSISRIDLLSDPRDTRWQTTPFLFSVAQPLFQYNPLRWQKKTEPLRYAIAEKQYAEALADLRADITDRFFAVYLAQATLINAQNNVSSNDTIYRLAQGRFEAGAIAENDLLQTELALLNARASVAGAELEKRRASYALLIALGRAPNAQVVALPSDPPAVFMVDTTQALAFAKENRSDWQNFDLQLLTATTNVRQAQANNRFTADLIAAFGFNQSGQTIDKAYSSPLDRQTLGFSFQAPIFQWGKGKAEINGARAAYRSLEYAQGLGKAQFEQEVIFQTLRLTLAQRQYILALKTDSIAQKRFLVSQNRYRVGKIDITNLQIAQNEKDSALRNLIQSLRDYQSAYYRLLRLTLFDFEKGVSLLSEIDFDALKRNFD